MTCQVLGVLEYRVERNLKIISRLVLVVLPSDTRFRLDQYVARQDAEVKAKTKTVLAIRNEVESALEDIVEVLCSFRTEANEVLVVNPDGIQDFKSHYSHLFYLAILNAVKRTFTAIKRRLSSRQRGGFLFVENPLFDVDVELTIPNVTVHPSLDEVQHAINESARLVLSLAKSIPILGDASDTYHSLIAADMQVCPSHVYLPLLAIALIIWRQSVHIHTCAPVCRSSLLPYFPFSPLKLETELIV
jgi:dynein heavy chain